MGLSPDVLTYAVLDRLVRPPEPGVGQRLVGVDRRVAVGVLVDESLERRAVGVLHHLRLHSVARAVPESGYCRLAHRPAAGVQLLVSVLVGLFATDVGLVRLDRPDHLRRLVVPRLAGCDVRDTMRSSA